MHIRAMSALALGGSVAAWLAVMPTIAHATAFCDVRKTVDGFVALRAEPAASGRLILRMKAGEQVQLDSTVEARKGWVHVHFWRDGAIRHSGWVSRGLIEKECG